MKESYKENLESRGIKIVPLAEYVSTRYKILHKCTMGHEWLAEPKRILGGRGCPICSGRYKKTNEEYLAELCRKGISHKPLEPYDGTHTSILHECSSGHVWKVRPSQILLRKGCPSCATYRMDLSKPATLYYIKITDKLKNTYYKIGVTSRTIKDRFRDESNLIVTELYSELFLTAAEALKKERNILSEFSGYKAKSLNILRSGGNTELFTIDILGLDT